MNDFHYQSDLNFVRYGFFAQASRKLLSGRFGFSFGLRTDGNTFTSRGTHLQETLSPRVSISYQLDKKGQWTINASTGRFFKLPAYTVLGFRDNAGTLVNKDAQYIQTDHVVIGAEHLISESSRISVEGFGKIYDQYLVSTRDEVSLANKGGGFEALGNEPVRFNGKGRTYGTEFLYQQKFNGKFYAIAALTLYRSDLRMVMTSIVRPHGTIASLFH